MSNRKKILFVLPTLNMGGAEKVTVNIANSLDSNIYNVIVLSLSSEFKALEGYINSDIKLEYLNIKRVRYSIFFLFWKIAKIKPDIVFSSLLRTNIVLLLIKLYYSRFKLVIREPSMPSAFIKNKIISKKTLYLIKFLYPFADKIIAQSEYMRLDISKTYNIKLDKIKYLSNFLDKKKILANTNSQKNPFYRYKTSINFVYVGRLSDEKNPLFLAEVFKEVVKINNKFNLFFIGTGVLEGELIDFIYKNNLENNIHTLGFKLNPHPYIKYADGLLLPSKWEGMPNVVLESFFLKTIVIATNSTPVLSDMIDSGVNGFLVNNFNPKEYVKYILNYSCLLNEFKIIDNINYNIFFKKYLA
jgi:glycosyltransferase involved in cell wall biosynthesis